jgi:hypothetical protein
VTSFEAITLNLVDQEDFKNLERVGEDITVMAERILSETYRMGGASFIPSNVTSRKYGSTTYPRGKSQGITVYILSCLLSFVINIVCKNLMYLHLSCWLKLIILT